MRRRPTVSMREVEPARTLIEPQGGPFRSFRRAVASLKNGVVTKHSRRMVRFCSVGILGIVVNTALLYLLTDTGGLNPLISAVFATEAAILNNFLLNDRWTFSDVERVIPWHRRALRYNSVALVGLVISVVTLAGLTHLLGIHYLIANLFAISAGTLWNYTGSSYFTWATLKFSTPSTALLVVPLIWCRRLATLVVAEVNKLWP